MAAALAVLAAVWIWAAWQLWDTSVPDLDLPDLQSEQVFDPALIERAENYWALLRWLTIASTAALVGVLYVYSKRGARFARESAAGPIGTGFLIGMMGLALVWLTQLPFGLVSLWWARRHDVLEIGYVEFVVQGFFGLAGAFLFICFALLVTMALARLLRSTWWLPATAVFVGLAALFAWASPYLTPGLKEADGASVADARALTAKEGMPPIPVRVEEVHEFTSQPNAYAFGLGDSRRIVLWDTLAEGPYSRSEKRTVIAHEIGHHKHRHIAKGVGWFALFALPAAFIVAVATRRRGLGDPRSVPVALFVVVVLSLLATPLMSASSRRYEAEADWTALEATANPQGAEDLEKSFVEDALSDPDPPGWFSFLFETHPSALERVEMARAWSERRR